LGNQAGGRGGYHEDLKNPKIGALTANHAHILKGEIIVDKFELDDFAGFCTHQFVSHYN
jgi:hypothetical protein